jgi:cysteine-rich repeat protein
LCAVVYAGVKVFYSHVIPPVCTQPLGGVVFGSHTNNQIIPHATQTITLTGSVSQNSWSISTVRVNWIPATVISWVWTMVVPIAVWTNQYIVAAESTDPICPNIVSQITLIRSSWWSGSTCETLVNLNLWHSLHTTVNSAIGSFTLFGTVAPWATVTINGTWVLVTTTWWFSFDVSLVVGTNTFIVKATLEWCTIERTITITRSSFYYGGWANYCGDGVVRSWEECDLWANNWKWLWCTTSCRLETPVTPPKKPESPQKPTFTPLPPFVLPHRLPDTWADTRWLFLPKRFIQPS